MDDNADRSAVALAVALATRESDKAQSAAAFARAVREARSFRVTGEPFAAARALARLAVAYAPVSKSDARGPSPRRWKLRNGSMSSTSGGILPVEWFMALLAWASVITFVTVALYKIVKVARAPLGVRWEVYPVPHEQG